MYNWLKTKNMQTNVIRTLAPFARKSSLINTNANFETHFARNYVTNIAY